MKATTLINVLPKVGAALNVCKFNAVELSSGCYGLELFVPCPDSGKYDYVLEFAEALGFDWMNDEPDQFGDMLYDYLGKITTDKYWFDLFSKLADRNEYDPERLNK